MKQFMVMCAVLPLLLAIIIQLSLDQINSYKLSAINQAVYSVAQESKQKGRYDYDMLNDRLVNDVRIDPEFISYGEDHNIYHRGATIPYYIKIKIDKPMVGMMVKKNYYYYVIDSCTASELP